MSRDKTDTPEPTVGSGGTSPTDAGQASRPASAGDVTPEDAVEESDPAGLASDGSASADPLAGNRQEPEAGGQHESDPPPEGAEIVEIDIEALTAKAEKADEYLDLAQRTRAEFENYRRRVARETAAAQERGAIKLALELLPAIDNLDRALAHAETTESNGDGSLLSGIKHVHSDLIAALKRADIEPYSPEGEPFDPQYHEAVAQQPFEGAEPGTVVEVYQRGYRRGDSVLRPARVIVAG
ncbi:MAG: nucleotide exchange factor GrpE [Solirubrobacteraceae bacterium]